MKRKLAQRLLLLFACCAVGCRGVQSALDPAGREAERLAALFWWMTAGTFLIWAGVVALAVYAARARPESFNRRRERLMIIGGGAVLPTIVLGVLLLYGLAMLPEMTTPLRTNGLKVIVYGERWWWRVYYQMPDGRMIETANEIRLPVNEPVQFQLQSHNVNHSFWIPPLGGKMDMLPGRLTYLSLRPTQTGVYRGACAEYCGESHALMSFYTEVMERAAFDNWLAQQAAPAQASAARGQELFFASGCNACHTIRGTLAKGVLGPDLTHVGSRLSLGAGILPNEPDAFRRWLVHTDQIKPGVLMPRFGMLPENDLQALAAYLEGLQ